MEHSSESSNENSRSSDTETEDDSQELDVKFDGNLIEPYSFEPTNEALSDAGSDASGGESSSSKISEEANRLDNLDW